MDEQHAPVIFSEWLKRRRRAIDITQEELANRVGCSVGTLRKIEAGDRRPSKQLAGLIAAALEIPDEDRQTFIRVARGELNLERLGRPTRASLPPLSDLWAPQVTQTGTPSQTAPGLARRANRIPIQETPLVGRDLDLAAMEKIFKEPQCRLLTLSGVGGVGKTRLAVEFAARNQAEFPGGVFYVPLTPVNNPQKIVPAIADVLDFGFSGPIDPKEQLLSYLSSNVHQETLFVFDNLEQLLIQTSTGEERFGLVELVSEILQRIPHIRILATSRERLNLHGEWTYEVHGLSVPPPHFVGRLEGYDSIALFIKSARRVKLKFEVMEEERESLVQICRLVDGVPLALELAAAWVSVLTCKEIAQEIQANMDFLTTSLRDIPERHRSIRATFDHSWNLLTDEERQVLSQLSVFQGGFDRHAAMQVAGASLHLLASLSAKSLVRRTESGRYDLHEVIRQYAWSHLKERSRNRDTYARHCAFYLKFLSEHERSLKRAGQQGAVRLLMDEIANIQAAWSWAIEGARFSQLEGAVRAYGWYFEISGQCREGIEQLERLVQAIEASPEQDRYARVLGLSLVHQALLCFRSGKFDRALSLYDASLASLRPIGDPVLLADALIYSGTILHLQGNYERGASLLEEGLALARAGDEQWFEAYAISNLGFIESAKGRPAQGYQKMMAALKIWRALGDPQVIALGLNFNVTYDIPCL